MKSTPLLPMPCLAISAAMAATSAVLCLCLMSQASSKELKAASADPCRSGAAGSIQEINPAFATNLYQQLRSTKGNVFYSPYSITEAMAMVQAGAKGDTAKQLATVLSLGDVPALTKRLQMLRQKVSAGVNQNGDQLKIANALCVTGEVPLQDYQTMIQEKFDGELFAGDLAEINGWVKEKTQGHIESILTQLDPDRACVILNAVYFKGNWQAPFDPAKTHDAEFHLANGKTKDVRMMRREGHYTHCANADWVAVQLPYCGNSSMVLIMPTKADEFEAFEAGLNDAFLAGVDQQLGKASRAPKKIRLDMPKFKIVTEYDLKDTMKEMGVKDAFLPEASDFSAMYEHSDIFISQIKHKATLEVDEQGTVSAAAAAADMAQIRSFIPPDALEFNRPFIVRIKENTSNTTLFMGRISDPSAE